MANRRGKGGSSGRFHLLGLQNHYGQWLQPLNQKMIASWQESNDKPRQWAEKLRHYSADKGPYSQGYGLPGGHIQLWDLDHKEGRTPKNWCLQTVVLEKTLESRLDCKEIKPVNPTGTQSWINSLEGLMLKSWSSNTSATWWEELTQWKDPDAGKD